MSRGLSLRARRFGKQGERAFIASRREAEKLTDSLLKALLRWQGGADVSQADLTQALLTGTPEDVAAAIMPPGGDAALQAEYERIAGQIIEIAGDAQWKELDFEASFNLLNPYSPQWMRTYGAELVTEIGDLSRYAIREEVARSFEQGLAPREIARTLGEWAGLRRDQSRALDLYAQGLRAAKVARLTGRLPALLCAVPVGVDHLGTGDQEPPLVAEPLGLCRDPGFQGVATHPGGA